MSRRRIHNRERRPVTARAQRLEPRVLFTEVAWDAEAQDGLWHTPLNWSNDQVPGPSDDVTIDLAATVTVTLAGAPATVASLTLGAPAAAAGGGTQTLAVLSTLTVGGATVVNATGTIRLDQGGVLDGSGDLEIVQGQMDWLGGTVEGGGAFRNQGTVRISGPATKTLRRRLENLPGGGPPVGTLEWTGGGDIVLIDGAISNRGVMDVSGTGAMRSGGGDNFVATTGAPLHQSGTTLIEVPFDSTGPITRAVTTVAGTLTLAGGGSSRGVFDVSGTLVFTGASFSVLGVGHLTGSGTARFDGGTHHLRTTSFTDPARLEVRNSGTDVEIYEFFVTDLVLSGGATLRATRGIASTTTLSVDPLSRLDLSNVGFLVNYPDRPSPLPDVRELLTSGYADGAWHGEGIASSAAAGTPGTALGYAEAAQLFSSFPADFLRFRVDDTAVLIRLTRYGDADLDGDVDSSDFDRMARSYGSGDRRDWSDGDFTFDGAVTVADFNRVAVQFPPAPPPVLSDDGTLHIEGTDVPDSVGLTRRGSSLRVRVNGTLSRFAAADVRRVEVRTRGAADVLDWSGTSLPTYADAGDGGDTITGGAGDDSVHGGAGDNLLFGGGGHDLLKAGGGHDTLWGEGGDDRLRGGAGDDLMNGGAGADRMWGQQGDDRLYGRGGNDALDGGPGRDRLSGDDGRDKLSARDGEADALDGGAGDDEASVDDQADTLRALEHLLT